MFCTDIQAPVYFIFSDTVPPLLYYSHIPAIVIALIVSFFVFAKRKNIASKALLFLSIFFSLWAFFSLVTWVQTDSRVIIFVWSLFGVLLSLIFVSGFAFIKAFVGGERLSFKERILFFFVIFPVIIFSPTQYAVPYFDLISCEAVDGELYYNYYYSVGLFFLGWIFIYTINKIAKKENVERKRDVVVFISLVLFLSLFLITDYLSIVLNDYNIHYYGLFGMVFFMVVIAYLIVKYQMFNIRLIAAQALVWSIALLILSQFAFIRNPTNMVLNGIAFVFASAAGFYLVKSVKKEIEQKEELEQLTQDLSEKNKRLIELDDEKNEFISIASHQLRTPLSAAKGMLSMILEGAFGSMDDTVRSSLQKLYTSNERLIRLVGDLLNVSRIESKRTNYDVSEVDMVYLIDEVIDALRSISIDRRIPIVVRGSTPTLPRVTGDESKMHELMTNLVDNALKYTDKGEVIIDYGHNTERVWVSVKDSGIGIEPDEMEALFRKFSRAKNVERSTASGTGLGLFVVKTFVEAHGGRIWAESEGANKGTTFIFELPVQPPADASIFSKQKNPAEQKK